MLVDVRLPDSASLERTQEVMAQIEQIALGTGSGKDQHGRQGGIHGIAHTIAISGQSFVQNAIGSNYGSIYVILDEFHHRHGSDLGADAIAAKLRADLLPRGPGSFRRRFRCPGRGRTRQCRRIQGHGPRRRRSRARHLQETADDLAATGNEQPGLVGLYSAFRARTPQMYVNVDRERCKAMGVGLDEVFLTLQLYLGGYLHQRLQPVRPHLAGQSAGRSRPADARPGSPIESPQLQWRDGAAGKRRGNQRNRRARAGRPLQRRDRRGGQRRFAAWRQLRHRHQDGRSRSPSECCRKA